jgi:hypothetical protein
MIAAIYGTYDAQKPTAETAMMGGAGTILVSTSGYLTKPPKKKR